MRGPFNSFDLSSATDRFPIEYQLFVIEELLGKEYAKSWKHLMVGLPFSITWESPRKGDDVYYRTGQPMGAYSSWAVFALCHHVLIRVAGHYAFQRSSFDEYFVLGDDVVIANAGVAKIYRRLMGSNLGVTINLSKSIPNSNSFEFAKRIFVDGIDCSPFTWTQLLRSENRLVVLATFLSDMIERSVVPIAVSIK